jgi:hypothetical protein
LQFLFVIFYINFFFLSRPAMGGQMGQMGQMGGQMGQMGGQMGQMGGQMGQMGGQMGQMGGMMGFVCCFRVCFASTRSHSCLFV